MRVAVSWEDQLVTIHKNGPQEAEVKLGKPFRKQLKWLPERVDACLK